jgi:hypothetical protein
MVRKYSRKFSLNAFDNFGVCLLALPNAYYSFLSRRG